MTSTLNTVLFLMAIYDFFSDFDFFMILKYSSHILIFYDFKIFLKSRIYIALYIFFFKVTCQHMQSLYFTMIVSLY